MGATQVQQTLEMSQSRDFSHVEMQFKRLQPSCVPSNGLLNVSMLQTVNSISTNAHVVGMLQYALFPSFEGMAETRQQLYAR